MPVFGRGLKANITGSTHLEDGERNVSSTAVLNNEILKLSGKITSRIDEITMDETYYAEDAEVLFYSYGSISRGVIAGVEIARAQGIKAGAYRSITVWPFPKHRVEELSRGKRAVVVCENNMGQMYYPVAAAVGGNAPTTLLHPDVFGTLIPPMRIAQAAKEVLSR